MKAFRFSPKSLDNQVPSPVNRSNLNSMEEEQIAKSSRFGASVAISATYFVYTTGKNIKWMNLKDATPSSYSCPTEPIELCFKEDTNLLASCDTNGTIVIINPDTNQIFEIENEGEFTVHGLCWHPQENHLAAIVNESNVYIWDLSELEKTYPERKTTLQECTATKYEYENEIVSLYVDRYEGVLVLEEGGLITKRDEKSITQLSLSDGEEEEGTRLFYFDNYLFFTTHNSATISVYEKKETVDDVDCMKLIQRIHLVKEDLAYQLSFIETSFDPSLLIISHPNQSCIYFFRFSSENAAFMLYEMFETPSHIQSHSAVEIDTNTFKLFCYCAPREKKKCLLTSYVYELQTEKLSISEPNMEVQPQPIIPIESSNEQKVEEELPKSSILTPETTSSLSKLENIKESAPNKKKAAKIIPKSMAKEEEEEVGQVEEVQEAQEVEEAQEAQEAQGEENENLLARIEQLINSKYNTMYATIKKEQVKRDAFLMKTLQKEIGVACKKKAQQLLDTKLNGSLDTFAKRIQEMVLQETTVENLISLLQKELYHHFTTVLGPSVENCFRDMFTQINESFELGIQMHFQQLQEPNPLENELQNQIDALSSVCNVMMGGEMEEDEKEEDEIIDPEISLESTVDTLLRVGDYKDVFSLCFGDDEPDELLMYIMGKLEGYSDWHGSVDTSTLLQIMLQLSSQIGVDTERKLFWLNDVMAYIHLDEEKMKSCGSQTFADLLRNLSPHIRDGSLDSKITRALDNVLTLARKKLVAPTPVSTPVPALSSNPTLPRSNYHSQVPPRDPRMLQANHFPQNYSHGNHLAHGAGMPRVHPVPPVMASQNVHPTMPSHPQYHQYMNQIPQNVSVPSSTYPPSISMSVNPNPSAAYHPSMFAHNQQQQQQQQQSPNQMQGPSATQPFPFPGLLQSMAPQSATQIPYHPNQVAQQQMRYYAPQQQQ